MFRDGWNPKAQGYKWAREGSCNIICTEGSLWQSSFLHFATHNLSSIAFHWLKTSLTLHSQRYQKSLSILANNKYIPLKLCQMSLHWLRYIQTIHGINVSTNLEERELSIFFLPRLPPSQLHTIETPIPIGSKQLLSSLLSSLLQPHLYLIHKLNLVRNITFFNKWSC